MRGVVRADVAVLGVGVMKSADFEGNCTDFRRIRSDSANQMPKMRLLEVPMYVLRKRSRRVGTFLDENLDFLRNSDKRKNVSTDWV